MDECAIDARSRLSSRLRSLWIAGLSLLAIGAIVVGTLALGDFGIPFGRVLQVLVQDDGSDAAFVIHEIRLPRLLTATLVGAALGLAGAIVQAITRNPLGEPGLLGVTAGAAFAMALCMTYLSLPTSAELAASTVGGIAAATLTLAIGMGARLDPLYLTLTGMSINLFFAAAIIVMLVSANVEVNGIYYWLTGSLINRTWEHVAMLWPWVVSGLVLGLACAGRLDTMILDEDVLTALGMRVDSLAPFVRPRGGAALSFGRGCRGSNHLHWPGRTTHRPLRSGFQGYSPPDLATALGIGGRRPGVRC